MDSYKLRKAMRAIEIIHEIYWVRPENFKEGSELSREFADINLWMSDYLYRLLEYLNGLGQICLLTEADIKAIEVLNKRVEEYKRE